MMPIHVLFGTESGNAQGLAKRVGEALTQAGFPAEVIDMMDFDGADLAAVRVALIVTSTYGNGDPPSNAEALHAFVMKKSPPLPNLVFSVCGLGDTTYDRFANCGKEFDERLEQLGATRLSAREDCDVDYEKPFAAWLARVMTALPKLSVEAAGALEPNVPRPAPSRPGDPPGTRRNPVKGRVLENVNLNGAGSTKETRHLVLSTEHLPQPYLPGDSIGIWPENDPDLVEEIARAAGAALDAPVVVGGKQVPLSEALSKHCELLHADARLVVKRLGVSAPGEIEDVVGSRHVIDILRASSTPLTPAELVDHLRPLAPRMYSIASSPRAHPGEVHLLVDIVRYELLGRTRVGVTSHHVAHRAPVGASLSMFLQTGPAFRLPSRDTDIIMIGPGTGVAPFRAFLEERDVEPGKGRSWLFFGSRQRAVDYLYEADLARFLARGALTRLDLAFSRDQERKVYVQHRMKEAAKDLFAWIEGGAALYVCGDAKHMAPDVHQALVDLLAAEGGCSADDARARLEALEQAGRYKRDVY